MNRRWLLLAFLGSLAAVPWPARRCWHSGAKAAAAASPGDAPAADETVVDPGTARRRTDLRQLVRAMSVLAATTAATAGRPGRLLVWAGDVNGEPLRGIRVSAATEQSSGAFEIVGFTDEEGRLELALPFGSCTVVCAATAYRTVETGPLSIAGDREHVCVMEPESRDEVILDVSPVLIPDGFAMDASNPSVDSSPP